MGMPYDVDKRNKPKPGKTDCQKISNWLRVNCYLMYKVSHYRNIPGGYKESAFSNSLWIKRTFPWIIIVAACILLLYFAFMNI